MFRPSIATTFKNDFKLTILSSVAYISKEAITHQQTNNTDFGLGSNVVKEQNSSKLYSKKSSLKCRNMGKPVFTLGENESTHTVGYCMYLYDGVKMMHQHLEEQYNSVFSFGRRVATMRICYIQT